MLISDRFGLTNPFRFGISYGMVDSELSRAAAILGKIGGARNTPAQNEARAKNAKKGGWPKGRKRGPKTSQASSATHLSSIPERSNG